jgi:hypothetical protein
VGLTTAQEAKGAKEAASANAASEKASLVSVGKGSEGVDPRNAARAAVRASVGGEGEGEVEVARATDLRAMVASVPFRPRTRREMRASVRLAKPPGMKVLEEGRERALVAVAELEEKAKGKGEFVALVPDRFLGWAQRVCGVGRVDEFPPPDTAFTILFDVAYGVDWTRFMEQDVADLVDAEGGAPWEVGEMAAELRAKGRGELAEEWEEVQKGARPEVEGAGAVEMAAELERLEEKGVVGKLAEVQEVARRPVLHYLFMARKGAVTAPAGPRFEQPWDACNNPTREGGKARLVADLRPLNALTMQGGPFRYEGADEMFGGLARGEGVRLSHTDVMSGYHTVRVDPRAAHLVAFRHPVNGDVYTWRRLPFGARQGPALFSMVSAVVVEAFGVACKDCGVAARAPRPWAYIDDLMVEDDEEGSWMARLRYFMAYLGLPTANAKTEVAKRTLVHLGWKWVLAERGELSVMPAPRTMVKAARALSVLAQQMLWRGLAPEWLVEHARGVCVWLATLRPAARSRIRGFGRALHCPRQTRLVATDANRLAADMDYWVREMGWRTLREAAEAAGATDEHLEAVVATVAERWRRERKEELVAWRAASDAGDEGFALHAETATTKWSTAGRIEQGAELAPCADEEVWRPGMKLSSTIREILPLWAWMNGRGAPRNARIVWASDSMAACFAVAAASSKGAFADALMSRLFDKMEELGVVVVPGWRQRELNAAMDVHAGAPDELGASEVVGWEVLASALALPTAPRTRRSPMSP